MDLYLFCLCVSFGGLVIIVLTGVGHHHGAGAHAHGLHHGGKMTMHRHAARQTGGGRPSAGLILLGLLSPRTFFSLLLGFGATGLLLRPLTVWPPVLLAILAVIGACAFERLIVQPLWNLLMGFASQPARTLDSAVSTQGTAVTDFDASGHGLVSIELDGQVRQILGTLPAAESASPRVRTGDPLVIRTVDHRRNTCTVARLGC